MIKIIEILSVVEYNTTATHANLVYFLRPTIIREIFNIHSNHSMMLIVCTRNPAGYLKYLLSYYINMPINVQRFLRLIYKLVLKQRGSLKLQYS